MPCFQRRKCAIGGQRPSRLAKANPGKIAMASAGSGHPTQLAGELFKILTGIETHVPYRAAGPATPDLLGGQVQVMFNGVGPAIEHIRSGRLRAVAATTDTRSPALPDIPTVGVFVPGYDASQWYAVGLRKSTPTENIDRLNKETNTALAGRRDDGPIHTLWRQASKKAAQYASLLQLHDLGAHVGD